MDARVLVTGGSGFIGTWVSRELLALQATPIVYDLAPNEARWQRIVGDDAKAIQFVAGDLTDIDALNTAFDKHDITHVIHLGALLTPACQEDPWLGCRVNILGSTAVFEQVRARRDNIKGLSYASSLAVFGPEPDDTAELCQVDDTHAPSFYGAFKRSVELIAQQYWQHFQIASFGMRPHVVYGPERDQGLTAGPSLACRSAARGEGYEISYSGAAGYDYVEDVARGFVRGAFETPRGANVVDLPSEAATPKHIVQLIADVVPGSAAKISASGPPIPSNFPLERTLVTSLFPDWQKTSLADGIEKTIAFYRQ